MNDWTKPKTEDAPTKEQMDQQQRDFYTKKRDEMVKKVDWLNRLLDQPDINVALDEAKITHEMVEWMKGNRPRD